MPVGAAGAEVDPGAAEARWPQTCTALDYSPMLALNRVVGLHEADVLSILEGELPAE